jgi:hypothetical protein
MISRLPDPVTAPIAGYHSKTEFVIPPEHADAIFRTSGYHRTDFERAVIWFKPGTHPDSVLSTTALREPTTSLGELDKLPLELINEICLILDMASLFRLRQVNVRARHVVNALHEYRVITADALNPFCALFRTRLASRVTLLGFYSLLCTQSCSLCDHEYGDNVFLLEWFRCCSFCIRRGAPRVATPAGVKRTLPSSKEILRKLPRMRTLPGIYTMDERSRSSRMTIVSIRAAFSASCVERICKQGLPNDVLPKKMSSTFMACCSLPSYDPLKRQIEIGASCAGCQLALEDGISIDGEDWAGDARDMVYSKSGFLKHFVWCEKAQLLWLDSKEGTVVPSKMPYVCKTGGFFKPRI